jgi:hypothetical protein
MKKSLFVILFMLLSAASAWGATKTVCPSLCDYTTIAAGLTGMASGDTLTLADGNYSETIYESIKAGTDAAHPTTIQAVNSRKAIIVVPDSGYRGITSAVANVKLDGLVFRGDLLVTHGYDGIKLEAGANYWTINDCEITGFKNDAAHLQQGILISEHSHHHTISNCKIANNGHDAIHDHCIYNEGNSTIVEHSELTGCASMGIQSWDATIPPTDNVYRYNSIHGNGRNGILLANDIAHNNLIYSNAGEGIALGYGETKAMIYNNTLYGNTAYGIYIYAGGTAPTGTLVTNNISSGNGTGSIYLETASTTTVSHNVLNGTRTDKGTTVWTSNLNDVDPLFASAATGDFSLLPTSPAIDSGVSLGAAYRMDFYGRDQDANFPWDAGAVSYRRGGGSASMSFVGIK